MFKFKVVIFGKKFEIRTESKYHNLLKETLELYKSYELGEADIVIELFESGIKEESSLLSNNPSIYKQYIDGFTADFGVISTRYIFNDNNICIKCDMKNPSFPRGLISKVRSMEYSSAVESFEQIFHELVLVPLTYFFTDSVPLHAAAIKNNNETYLIAGTGGVGKSSAILAFRELKGAKFIADDISVLNDKGLVFGNMAWPKVYGYNCIGNDLKEKILSERSWHDKIHYQIKSMQGLNNVRRKVKPNEFFHDYEAGSSKVNKMFLLFREDTSDFSINEMTVEQAIESHKNIMRSEYGVFHKFLDWGAYNCSNLNIANDHTMEEIEDRWAINLRLALKDVKLYRLSVPIDIQHTYYKENIISILEGGFFN